MSHNGTEAFNRNGKIPWLISLLCALCLTGAGCPTLEEVPIEVGEVVGVVSDSSAEVFLQLGLSTSLHKYAFKMGYDTSSHAQDRAYLTETPIQTDKRSGDKVVFAIPAALSPNTKYYYSIAYRISPEGEWIWRPESSFHTRRAPGSPFRFCVISDFHKCFPPITEMLPVVSRNVAADEPDFVISLGDMAPLSNQGAGIPTDCILAYSSLVLAGQLMANNCYSSMLANIMNEFSHSSMLLWVNGNHDGLAGYLSACPQYGQVLEARRKYLPLLNQADPNAFFGDLVWGDVHIIWLDPLAFSTYDPYAANHPPGYKLGSEQMYWLEDTLAGSTSRWKLIFAHSLFGGAGPDFPCPPEGSYARGNANFVNTPGTDQIYLQALMEAYGVNAYLYGHDHMYSVSEYGGVKYVLVGTGHTSYWTECLVPYYAPWDVIRDQSGHLRVDVNSDSLVIHYVNASLDETNGEILATHQVAPGP